MLAIIPLDRRKTTTCKLKIASRGSRSTEERKKREREEEGEKETETEIDKRRKRENRCVTRLAISGTVDEGAAESGRIRSSVFRSVRPDRAIVARVYSRFSRHGRAMRPRVRGACVCTQHTLAVNARRERDPRHKAT